MNKPLRTRPNRLRRARKLAPRFILTAAFAFCLPAAVKSATLVWDADGTTGAPTGGTGAWDTVSALWDNAGVMQLWNNAANDVALFGGTAGTVTLGAPITAGGLEFDTSGYTIAGNTLTLAAPTGSASPVIRVATLQTATIGSTLAGTSGFTKTGTGTLTLTSAANTYSGDTVINDGRLVITSESQLGTAGTTIAITGIQNAGNPGYSGGSLVLNGVSPSGPLMMTREISIMGRGPHASNNSGAIISIGDNVLNGDLNMGGNANGGSALATHGITTVNGNVLMGGSGQGDAGRFHGNGNWIISGRVSGYENNGQDRFIKAGNIVGSTLWLQNSANDYLQMLRIDSGTVRVSDNGALGNSTGARSVDLNGGRLEVLTDSPNFDTRNVFVRATTGLIFLDRQLGGSGLNETVNFHNLAMDNGILQLDGRNGYSFVINGQTGAGTTTSWAGGGNAGFTNASNGTFTFDGTIRKSDATARTFTIGGNGETIITGNYEGVSGAHVLTKNGVGTLTIGGTAGTYTGNTNINQGTISISSFGALNNNAAALNIGSAALTGVLEYTGAAETLTKVINLNGTTGGGILLANGTGAMTVGSNFTATGTGVKTLTLGGVSADDNTIAGVIGQNSASNTTSVLKIGGGTWQLAGANTYTGTTGIAGGTLKVQDTFSGTSRDVIQVSSALRFDIDLFTQSAGGTFEYAGDGSNASAETVGALTPLAGAGTVLVTPGVGGTAELTFASLAAPAAGSGVNFVTSAGGSVVLTGAADVNGILNAHLFFNGADFASGSTVGAATYTPETTGASLTAGNALPYLVNTTDIAAQATATINAGIKFNDTRNFTLAGGATLTLNNGAGISGGLLVTGGSSVTISGGTGITSGGSADLVFRTDTAGDTLTLNTPIASTTTGGWTKLGAGTLILGAANANTTGGQVHINEGTVQLSGAGRLGADSVDVRLRQGAVLDINGINLGTATSGTASIDEVNGAGAIINSGAAASIRIGNGNGSSYFTGTISGPISLAKNGTGAFRLQGEQNYNGVVTINAGTLDVTSLADIGMPSSLGTGDATDDASNAASLVFNGATTGTLSYTGSNGTIYQTTGTPSVSINRLFTLAGNGLIASNGRFGAGNHEGVASHASLIFNNTAPVAFSGAGARTLTLTGDSTGDNEIKLQLIDNPNAGESLSIAKTGAGLWILGNTGNDYSGTTTISGGGVLRVGDDSSALTRTLPSNSALLLGVTTTVGILQTEGLFTRPVAVTATPGNVTFNGTTGGGGFAASNSPLVVNLGGLGDTLQWGAGGFVGTGGTQTLFLSSTTSWADVTFENPIDLNVGSGTVSRIVQVDDNGFTGLDYATLAGAISNSGGGTAGLQKNGGGNLILGDANTYNGNTTITAGSLFISSIGNTASASSSLGGGSGSLVFNGNTTLNAVYFGAGETTDRPIAIGAGASLTANQTQRISSDGVGPLVLENLSFGYAGSAANRILTLELRGSNTDANTITSVISNHSGSNTPITAITKSDGGVWILNPTGTNTFTGILTVASGMLGLTADGIGSASQINMSNASIFGFGGPLTITPLVQMNNNTATVFTGENDITIDRPGLTAIQKASGANDQTLSNNLESGAVLTINGNFVNLQTATATRSINVRGYGSTVWNGILQNNSATSLTQFNFRLANNASFTLSGAENTYTGGTLLGQGILIIDKVGALGPSGVFTFNGGAVTVGSSLADLTGANALINPVTFAGDPSSFTGSKSIELSGVVTNSGGTRNLVNDLTGGATLTLSGGVNLSNDATNRTLVLRGTGDTLISSVITNGPTSAASALLMRGSGTLTLSEANTYDGVTTVDDGVLVLSGNGALDQNSVITVNGRGTLRIDNSGTNLADRVSDNPALDLNLDGGKLEFISDGVSSSETFGRLDINGNGLARVEISGGGSSTLTFAAVNFANTGSSLDLSAVPGLGGANKVIFTTAPTGAAVSNGILLRVLIGSDFAEYDGTNGVQSFTAYNTSNDLVAAANTDTMHVTASANIANSRALNALKLDHATGVAIGGTLADATLTLTGGAVLATGGGTHDLNLPLLNTGANGGFFQVGAGTTLNVNGALTGAAYTQMQGGSVNFNTPQFFTSSTNLHGGTLKLVSGGLNTLFPNRQAIFIDPGVTLDLNGGIQFSGNITTSSIQPNGGGTIMTSAGTGTIVTDAGGNWMGEIVGDVNLGRVGGGTLTIGSPQTYTGWTFLTGGTTTLRDNATILGTTAIDINQATLLLDNNANLQTQINDRLSDTAAITLRGGTITYQGRVHENGTETLGPITASLGANTISANNGGTGTAGAFATTVLTIDSLTRDAGTTINFTGSNLGSAGNNSKMIFTTPLSTVGKGVLGAWAIANTSDYAAYNPTNGVGLVGQGGYVGYDATFASGNITNLGGGTTAATAMTLPAGTTTTGLLRFQGAFTNDLEFAGGADTLHLELGGILRSNNNNATTIGTPTVRGNITSGTSELVVYNNQNTLTINSAIQGGGVSLIKAGGGTLNLTAANTYSGGTFVNQGTVTLNGDIGAVVIPAGGITLSGGTMTMVGAQGQIDSSNAVTINGTGTLTFVGNNTLDSITFNNIGGTGAPTVNAGGILTLTNAAPITVTSNNAITLPVVTGTLDFGSLARTISVGSPELNGVVYDDRVNRGLNIAAVITGTASITKTGTGLLQFSGQSTFTGGVNVTAGGIVLGASSTSTLANSLFSGPLGLGSVSMSAGTTLLVDDSSRTVANAFNFAADPVLGNTGVTTDTLTLNGALTFSTLGTSGLVVNINTPYLNVVLGGDIQGIGAVTAIGSGSGANTINKTGLGNVTGLNITGISNTAAISLEGLTNSNAFTLLHDGDGTSSLETINLGTVSFNPVNGGNLSLTIGRAGSGLYFPLAALKTIALASLNATALPNGITVVNNNNYGLVVPDNITLASGNVWQVNNANTSLQPVGLTLSGVISGTTDLTKAGNGVLRLGNAGNDFTGTIVINDGTVEVSSDAALGNSANVIQIGSNSVAEGLRISGTFATSRTIHLNAASSGLDVTADNVFTLNAPFTFATATNELRKNDRGTLVLTQAQPGWDGAFIIQQGVVRLEDGAALGTTTGNTRLPNIGGTLELPGGITVNDPIQVLSTNNSTSTGYAGAGAIRSSAGTNTIAGTITIDTTTTDANSRGVSIVAVGGSTLDITGGIVLGVGTAGSNRDNWVALGGAGTINLTTTGITHTGNLANGIGSLTKFGTGTVNIQVADALTAQNVSIKQGTLSLNGAGTFGVPGTGGGVGTVFLNPTATLVLDNSGTNVNDRLSSRNLNVSGSDLTILGNSSAGTSETVGAFTLREGISIFTLDADAAQSLDFTTGAITRSTGATLLVRGDNFGMASGAGVATMKGGAYAFVGQLGDTGTTNKSIIPWALGDTSLAGVGIGFVTSDSTGGAATTDTNILRLLTAGEQVTDLNTANANVNLSTVETLASLATINSLQLGAGGGVALAYVPLTLDSGGLLTLAGNAGISGFSGVSYLTTTSNRELILHTHGDLTLDIPIAGTTGALTKSGAGTLTLGAGNTNHSTVFVNEGTLVLGGGDHTILPGRTLQLNHGSTIDLNGTVQNFNALESRQTAFLSRNDLHVPESGGSVINTSGTQATLSLRTNLTFTGTIAGNIALAASTAAGATADTNFYADQTYTGPTLISGGRLILQDAARLGGTSSIELSNATLLVNASNGSVEAANLTDRINDAASILLRGGMFQLRTRGAIYMTETFGDVTLGGGGSVIDFAEAGTNVNQADATLASLSRTTGAHGTVRFLNIDGTPNDDQRLFINTLNGVPTTNIGDGLTNNLIGGWATFEREFASYIPGHGVAGLNTQGFPGYSPNVINDSLATDNIRIAMPVAGSTTTLTGNRTINSLAMIAPASATGNSVLNLDGNTLTLVSGGMILSPITDGFGITVQNGNLTAGTAGVGGELFIHGLQWVNGQADNTGNRDITLGANIVDNAGGAVTLVIAANQGRGTLAATNDVFVTGNNTYTGGTWVNSGRIVLNNTSADGVTTTATGTGDVTIAGGYGFNAGIFSDRNTQVIFGSPDQLANTASVTIMGGAELNLANFSQTIAGLTFDNHGGTTPTIATGTGTLTVTGSTITASSQNTGSVATITGKLALNAATTTFAVNPVEWNGANLNPNLPSLTITASIEGTDVIKTGNGLLGLNGANAWTGSIDLQAGGLLLGNNNALSSGTLTIGQGTFLASTADNRIIANDFTVSGDFALRDIFNLTLNGAGLLPAGSHAISVEMATKTLTLGGIVSGAGSLTKVGDGILVLSNNSNSYGGSTTVADGVLRYGGVDAVPTGTAMTVLEGAALDITTGGSAVTLGSLASDSATAGGIVVTTATSGTVDLTVGADDSSTDFGGSLVSVSGATLNFAKVGAGTLTLGGLNFYNGTTTVANGRLIARPVGGNSPLGSGQSLIMGGGSASGILQLGDSSGALSHTFTSFSSAGSGTANQVVSGNAGMATLTLDLASTSTFAGNIGGAGANEGNLHLVKSGAGDLVISGTGTSTYSGTTTVSGGKLFFDTPGAFPTTTTSLTLADGTEFSLRGSTLDTVNSYGFSGSGNVVTVGSSTGATLGFALAGTGNTRLTIATGQTMTVNGTLTTAVYVNSAPIDAQPYILIDGADANSLHAGGGTFNLSPVIFNGGSFSYALSNETLGGTVDRWVLTPTAVAAAANTWWKGDLTGLGTGVWSATTTTGTGAPSNWDDDQTSGIDAVVPPDSGSIVHFSANGAANFTTTLGANMTIQELIFHTGNPVTSIGSSNGINTLTLGNTVDASGLTMQTGVGDVSISAIVALAQDQSWNIEDNSSVLTLSGGLAGTGRTLTVNDLTTSGTLLFSGSAATMTGAVAIHSGILAFEDTGSLNSALDVVLGTAVKAATLRVGNTTAAMNAVIGGLSNGTFAGSSVVGGNATISTLTIGATAGTHTFTGALGGAGANENNFIVEKAGAGTQIINGAATYSGTTTVREGTLQLGTSSTFTPGGALSVFANAGATATFDFNGNNYTTIGDLTLGGGTNGVAQILDTAATKGVVTLGGNIIFDATGDPGAAVISTNFLGDGANRTITVGESVNAADDLTLNGTFTSTTNNSLSFAGAGSGVINGNISILNGAGTTKDVNFNSTGTWTINAKIEVTDSISINTGVINATVGESLDATNDVIVDGTGTQGSAIVNISSTAQVHTGDDIFIRNGGQVNVLATGGIGTGTDVLLVGDSASATAAAAGLLNLVSANISPTGLQVGASGNIGNVTGTGTITTTGTKTLANGSIESGIVLAGNGAITKNSNGTMVFSGERAVASTGATNFQEGSLVLDYTTNNNSKIGGVFNVGLSGNAGARNLVINGNAAAATVQDVVSTTILPGASTVTINPGPGQTATLNLGAITRTLPGGLVFFEYADGNAKATSTSPAGTLGWATVMTGAGEERLAAIDLNGDIVQATLTVENDPGLWAAGQNVINDAAYFGLADECNTITSLTFAATGASTVNIAAAARLGITSGAIMVDSTVGAAASQIQGGELYGSSTGALGEIIVHQNNALGALTIGSRIVNSSGITKTGAGSLILAGSNTFLSTGSRLHIDQGTVQLNNASAVGATTSLLMAVGTTLNLNNNNVVFGSLLGGGTSATIALGTGGITFNQTVNATYSGVFTGTAASVLTLNGGTSNFNINGATTTGFTGSVVVNSGLLQLSVGGRLANATSFTLNKGATMLLDNNGGTTSGDRILNTATITLNSADGAFSGETRPRGLAIRRDQDATLDETVGTVTLASGASYLSLEATTANDDSDIIVNDLVRTAGATLNARGTNLGSTATQNNQFRIGTAGNQTAFIGTLIGGGGGAGTQSISIVPWAIGQTMTGALADTTMGNSLLTYVSGAGLRPLDLTTEYATYTAAAATDNVRESLTASLTGLAGKTVNSLVINKNSTGAGTIDITGAGAGNLLLNTSGAFLFTQNTGAAASSAHTITLGGFDDGIQVGGNEYVMFVVNPSSAATTAQLTATIGSPLNSAGASLTKSGRGTLELTAVNTYGGGTTINEGAVLIHDNDNLGSGAITLAGGTLRLAADYGDDLGTLTTPTLNVLTGGGMIDVLGTTATATGLAITGSGPLTKVGANTLQLAGGTASTLTGNFTVLRGTLELNKTPGVDATGTGALNIGGSTVTNESATVTLLASDQINDGVTVNVRSVGTGAVGTLDLNGLAETIAELTMATTTGSGVLVRTGSGGTLAVAGEITLNNDRNLNDSGTNARNVVITSTGTNGTAVTGGGTLDLGGVARVIRVQTTSTLGANNDATIEVVIANGAIIKEGARRLFLTAANTYSGVTTINDGTISIAASENLGDGSATNTIAINNGAILRSTGAAVDLGVNRSIVLDGSGGTFEVTGAGNLVISGVISGHDCAVLEKTGTGTLSLSGTNIYEAVTRILAGTLKVGDGGTSGTLGTGDVLNDAILAFDRSDTHTVSNAISGSGSVRQVSTGRTVLSGVNSYTGTTTVVAGTLQFATPAALYNGAPASWTATNIIVDPGATLAVNVGGGGEFGLADILMLSSIGTGSGGFRDGSTIGFDTTNGDFTLSVPLGDTNGGANALGVTKIGSGVLTLTATNTNTGATTADDGILRVGAAEVLSDGSELVINASGTVDLNGFSDTVAALSGSGVLTNALTATNSTITVNGSANTTFDGLITNVAGGVLNLVKNGTGTLTLTGANTYDGTTTVSGGILSITNAQALGTTAAGTSVNGGTLELSNDITVIGEALTLAGAGGGNGALRNLSGDNTWAGSVTLSNDASISAAAGTLTLTGALGDGGTAYVLTKVGAGTLVLSADSSATFQSQVAINGGTLRIGAAVNLGDGSATNTLAFDGGSLEVTGSFDLGVNRAIGINAGGGTIAVTGANELTVSGALSGSGSLTKSDTGVLVLTADNSSFSGPVAIDGGVVSIAASNRLGDESATNTLSINGGTLRATASFDLTSSRTIAVGASGATLQVFGSAANSLTVSGSISGSGEIAKSGIGIVTLSGNNSGFSGPITMNNGTVSAAASNNLGDASATNTLAVNGATLEATGTFDLGANRTVALGAGGGTIAVTDTNTLTASGAFSGTTGLTKVGTGTLALAADNSGFSGPVAINGGTVAITASNNLGSGTATNTLALDGGTLESSGAAVDLGTNRTVALSGGGGTFAVTSTNSLTVSGAISGSAGLTKAGTGTLVLSGDNSSFTGGTTIAGGTLSVAAANNLGGTSGINFNGTGVTLAVTGSLTASQGLTFTTSGTIDVATAQTFTTTGTLSGAEGFTKAGTGTLLVNADNSAYTGPVTVAAGTFGGTGAVGGDVTVAGGATLAPGASIGTFGAKSLTLDDGAAFSLEIDLSNPSGLTEIPGNADLLQLSQIGGIVLSIGTGDSLVTTTIGTAGSYNIGVDHWTIATYESTGTWSGFFRAPGFGFDLVDYTGNPNTAVMFELAPGLQVAVDYNYDLGGGMSAVALVVVPEPGSMATLAGAAGLLLGLQRFRRRRA